jgi:hypothetical protein
MVKTVIVGCKIPTGLTLQLRDERDAHIVKAEVRLQGTMVDVAPYQRESAVGLTTIDGEFWEAWVAWATKNQYEPFVKGFIFASDKEVNVKAEAKEKVDEMTMLERLRVPLKEGEVVRKDPRLPSASQDITASPTMQ